MDMPKLEGPAAAGVLGLAGFSLLSAWSNNAPSIQDLRDAPPRDAYTKRKLRDAEILVGGVVIVVGVAHAKMSRDPRALIVMALVFAFVASWHHAVLNSNNHDSAQQEATSDPTHDTLLSVPEDEYDGDRDPEPRNGGAVIGY